MLACTSFHAPVPAASRVHAAAVSSSLVSSSSVAGILRGAHATARGKFVQPMGVGTGDPGVGTKRRLTKLPVAATLVAEPPAPPITGIGKERKPKFAQCIVEYNDKSGKARGEGWLFHIEAATEDEARAEVKPSFPRLLKRSAHIWVRDTAVTCTPLETLPVLGAPCAECVRFFTGGIYGTGLTVPAVDYSNPKKTAWDAAECLALREVQPPTDGVPSEGGGGSMAGHETRMSPFCRTNTFPGFD
eukprot:CAMPEP_0117554316 /NCGR_PEP_ID=MMETSP0784-20121206/50692_1 /TAXON_ID=39447 /ORGANISM="" /LENGTH=244 /DNA_ID=CAMNT_0005351479 /DNA_START=170 /DNA_END=904 /DNA_ORIENTATION=-